MTELNFITIKDHSTSNALWNGEEIYIAATKALSLSSSQQITASLKNYQNISVSEDEDNYATNFNRRKSSLNYGGFNNAIINLSCIYNPLTMNLTFIHDAVERQIFTPSKLYQLISRPTTVYLKDEFLIRTLLATEETNGVGNSPAIYTSKGIPVVLTNWTLTPSVDGKEIIMNLSFIEDKEI